MLLVRDASPEDAGRLLEIYGYYVQNTAITFEYETPSLAEFRERMARVTETYPYLAALEDGRLQGYAYAAPLKDRAAYDWSCELTVYLDRGARGRGLGRALYEALERALGEMGIRNLYACIGLPDRDDEYLTADSARFHAHMGFTRIGEFRQCGCKFGRWYNMVWMEKHIGEHGAAPAPVTPYPALRKG